MGPTLMDLPCELQDRICSFLNIYSASPCSLLSRHWSRVARTRVFDSVSIDFRNSNSTVDDLTDFVNTESFTVNRLGRYIRTLSIGSEYHLGGRLSVSEIARLLPSLRALRTLRLIHVDLHCGKVSPDPMYGTYGLRAPSLNNLSCPMVSFQVVSSPSCPPQYNAYTCSAVDLLSLFDPVHMYTLRLSDCHLTTPGVQEYPPPHLLAEIESSVVQNPSKACVKTFEYHSSGSNAIDAAIVSVLRASGQFAALERLQLDPELVAGVLHNLRPLRTLRNVLCKYVTWTDGSHQDLRHAG